MSVKVSYKSNHGIQGSYDVPLDKSIAQRSAILGLSTNTGVEGEDIVSTKKQQSKYDQVQIICVWTWVIQALG